MSMNVPITGSLRNDDEDDYNYDAPPPSTKGRRQQQQHPKRRRSPRNNNSSILSAGSEVLRHAPPIMPGVSGAQLGSEHGGSAIDRVRDLQEALSQNDFPSKVFQYLSVGGSTSSTGSNGGRVPMLWEGGSDTDGMGSTMGGGGYSLAGSSMVSEGSEYTSGQFTNEAIQKEMERLSQHVSGSASSPPSSVRTGYHAMSKAAKATVRQETSDDQGAQQVDEKEIRDDISTSSSDEEEDEEDRPVSPIIIWRPSARVQIADDLPPELLAELLGHPPPHNDSKMTNTRPFIQHAKRNNGGTTLASSGRALLSSGGVGGAGGVDGMKRVNGRQQQQKSLKQSFLKKDYGAWYLKPKKWNEMMTGGMQQEYEKSLNVSTFSSSLMIVCFVHVSFLALFIKDFFVVVVVATYCLLILTTQVHSFVSFFLLHHQARISGSDAEIEKVIEKKAKELDSVLPKLFISTAYLDWLEKQEMEHPESALPIPYYLKKKKKMSKRK